MEGLFDAPRSGAPRRIGDDRIEEIVKRTLETTARRSTHWSTREMAKDVGVSQWTVSRIWRAFSPTAWRSDRRPFLWTKTGDQILESVRRFCEHILADHVPEMLSRTSDSGLPTATHPRCQAQHS